MSDGNESSKENVTSSSPAASSDLAGGRRPGASEAKPERDFWDYVEILARPVAASLTALAIAGIGLMGNCTFRQQQANDSRIARDAIQAENLRAAAAQDHRLFTELMSKREDAETGLRKDMFTTILGDFFEDPRPEDAGRDIPMRLLKLEMLALNFGESLSLTPLFIELDRDIHETGGEGGNFSKLDMIDQRDRLHSLARRVSGRQLSALAPGGMIFEFNVNVQDVVGGKTFRWPDDRFPTSVEAEANSVMEFDGIKRTYTAEFSNAKRKQKTVDVHFEIQTWDMEADLPLPDTIEMDFELNFFNFPMVDNTRLSSDQRFALIMERFGDDKTITVVGVCFRGMYSSQRDKPFLDDVINQLNRETPD